MVCDFIEVHKDQMRWHCGNGSEYLEFANLSFLTGLIVLSTDDITLSWKLNFQFLYHFISLLLYLFLLGLKGKGWAWYDNLIRSTNLMFQTIIILKLVLRFYEGFRICMSEGVCTLWEIPVQEVVSLIRVDNEVHIKLSYCLHHLIGLQKMERPSCDDILRGWTHT